MKYITAITSIFLSSQLALADNVHPLVANYSKTLVMAYEHALHNVGYTAADFDNLIGVSSVQDSTRKIRVIKYKFSGANCAKDLELYLKLDGSSYLANKVVGCAP